MNKWRATETQPVIEIDKCFNTILYGRAVAKGADIDIFDPYEPVWEVTTVRNLIC